jgi:hypothetical protein
MADNATPDDAVRARGVERRLLPTKRLIVWSERCIQIAEAHLAAG